MYSNFPQIVLGFHGCDKEVAENVIKNQYSLLKSNNNYDWLGHGVYFWENNYKRALEFANEMMNLNREGIKKIKNPSVIGAVISLGNCLNLLDSEYLEFVQLSYDLYSEAQSIAGYPLPVNKPIKSGKDLLLRHLDCAVIEFLHTYNEVMENDPFDSVRGVFFEGDELFPGAGFKEKNHIQVCVRNPNCIKGFFHPRDLDDSFARV